MNRTRAAALRLAREHPAKYVTFDLLRLVDVGPRGSGAGFDVGRIVWMDPGQVCSTAPDKAQAGLPGRPR
jgi:hypothetical protein